MGMKAAAEFSLARIVDLVVNLVRDAQVHVLAEPWLHEQSTLRTLRSSGAEVVDDVVIERNRLPTLVYDAEKVRVTVISIPLRERLPGAATATALSDRCKSQLRP
jgi:hypothetical protein